MRKMNEENKENKEVVDDKDSNWDEVQPNVWKPENVGDSVEGVLVSVDKKGSFDSNAYTLDSGSGFTLVWGSAVLDERLACVNVGDRVKVEYKGTEKTKDGKKEVKIFKVYRAKKKLGE
jgi:hypothetical protein